MKLSRDVFERVTQLEKLCDDLLEACKAAVELNSKGEDEMMTLDEMKRERTQAMEAVNAWDLLIEQMERMTPSANGTPRPVHSSRSPSHRKGRKVWNAAQKAVMRNQWPEIKGLPERQKKVAVNKLAKELGRKSRAVRQQASRMGLNK